MVWSAPIRDSYSRTWIMARVPFVRHCSPVESNAEELGVDLSSEHL